MHTQISYFIILDVNSIDNNRLSIYFGCNSINNNWLSIKRVLYAKHCAKCFIY